jgi:hypothetical protein
MMTIFLLVVSITAENTYTGLNLSIYKDIATIIGVIIAVITLILGLLEYARQGKQKRAEHFFNLRKKLKENPNFKKICALLERDDEELINIPFEEKRDFLGLFEEVAIMKKSRLIKLEVTYYMFGYYAIKCWRSQHFWSSVNRDSLYWKIFKDFAVEAIQFESENKNLIPSQIKI